MTKKSKNMPRHVHLSVNGVGAVLQSVFSQKVINIKPPKIYRESESRAVLLVVILQYLFLLP